MFGRIAPADLMNVQSRFDLHSAASVDVLQVARRWVAPAAAVIAGVAIAADPAELPSVLALVAAVAAFAAWAAIGRGVGALVAVAVVGAVTGAQLSGRLEPAMFLLTLLVVIAAASEASWVRVIIIAALACANPLGPAAARRI